MSGKAMGKPSASVCIRSVSSPKKKNLCQPGTAQKIRLILNAYGLPDTCHLPMSDLMDAISLDKKNLNNHLNLVLLHQIGDSYVYPADLTFFDQADEI